MKRIDARFAERIRSKRKAKSLRQYQLANLVGIDPVYISQIETGRKVPTVPIAKRLAIELDDNVEEYIRWAALHRAQGDAKKYFEPPSARYPNMRGLILSRCKNRKEMEQELGNQEFGFLEKLIVHTLVIRALEMVFVDTELKAGRADITQLKDDLIEGDMEPEASKEFLEKFGELAESATEAYDLIEDKLKREYNLPGRHLLTMLFNSTVESWSFDPLQLELHVSSPVDTLSITYSFHDKAASSRPPGRGLGSKLRQCRKDRDLTLGALAKEVGVVNRALEKLENDRSEVDLEVLGKILAKLKVAPEIEAEGFSLDSKDHQYFRSFSSLSKKSQKEVDDFLSFKLQQEKAMAKEKSRAKPRESAKAKKK